jgi:hypothetical protein
MAGTFNDLQLISLARFLCESARNLKLEEQRFRQANRLSDPCCGFVMFRRDHRYFDSEKMSHLNATMKLVNLGVARCSNSDHISGAQSQRVV